METKDYTSPFEEQTRILFFAALTVCLSGQLLYLSMWPYHGSGNAVSYLGLIFLIPRFVTVLGCMNSNQKFAILFITPIILFICYNVIDKLYILLPFVFAVAAKNIKFRLIIKYFFLINLAFLISSYLFTRIGMVKDYVAERDVYDILEQTTGDEVSRHTFGYNWVTAFPAHVTYLWVMWLYLRKGIYKIVDYLLLFFSIWFVYHFCNARMESAALFLLILLSFYYRYRIIGSKNSLMLIENLALRYSVPFYAVIIIFLTYQYYVDGGEFYEILNIIMTGRLQLGADAMFTAGIPMFGQAFEQVGGDDAGNAYNFIDSSYLVWLIIYGLFFFILAISSLTFICNKSVRSREYLIAIIMSLLALEGSVVSIFLNFAYNPFLMALFAKWDRLPDSKSKRK